MANNYLLMGEPEDALKYAREAERLLLRDPIPIKPSKKGSLRLEVFGFSIPVWRMDEIGGASAEGFTQADELTLVYSLIGRSYEEMKSYQGAIDYEFKRLDIFRKRKDRLAERISLNRLGRLHFKRSDAIEIDSQDWQCFVTVRRQGDHIVTDKVPLDYYGSLSEQYQHHNPHATQERSHG